MSKECKDCIWRITDKCDGEKEPCKYLETYEDWEKLDSLVEAFRKQPINTTHYEVQEFQTKRKASKMH